MSLLAALVVAVGVALLLSGSYLLADVAGVLVALGPLLIAAGFFLIPVRGDRL